MNAHQVKSSILFAHQFLNSKSFVKEVHFKAIFKVNSSSHGKLSQEQVIQIVSRRIINFR